MDKLIEILSHWKGRASVLAILALITAALFKRVRQVVSGVLVDYVAAHWRRFWFWISNKLFLTSGGVRLTFAGSLTVDPNLFAEFDKFLRAQDSAQLVDGNMRQGIARLRLTEINDAVIELEAVTGQQLVDMYADGTSGSDSGGGTNTAGTLMTIRWEKIAMRYRELHSALDSLRRIVDRIAANFGTLVSNGLPEQNTYIEVFFSRDAKVEASVEQNVKVPNENVIIKRMRGKTTFGASKLDDILPYLPSYLVKETISGLMEKLDLTT